MVLVRHVDMGAMCRCKCRRKAGERLILIIVERPAEHISKRCACIAHKRREQGNRVFTFAYPPGTQPVAAIPISRGLNTERDRVAGYYPHPTAFGLLLSQTDG